MNRQAGYWAGQLMFQVSSFRRKPESSLFNWTPAFAGATAKNIFVPDR
jgi:hypothetical protein